MFKQEKIKFLHNYCIWPLANCVSKLFMLILRMVVTALIGQSTSFKHANKSLRHNLHNYCIHTVYITLHNYCIWPLTNCVSKLFILMLRMVVTALIVQSTSFKQANKSLRHNSVQKKRKKIVAMLLWASDRIYINCYKTIMIHNNLSLLLIPQRSRFVFFL